MEIYDRGRLIDLDYLNQISTEQKVNVWLIGEAHSQKECWVLERECALKLKPEYILAESRGKRLISLSNKVKAILIDCDTATEEAISRGAEGSLIACYGTADIEKIARKYYDVVGTAYRKRLRKHGSEEMFLSYHIRKLENDAKYAKWWEDVCNIQEEGEDSARETEMGKNISRYMEKSARPIIGILGDHHLKPRAGNLFRQLENKTVLVLNPREFIDRTTKLEGGDVEFHDFLNNALSVDAYNAVILKP